MLDEFVFGAREAAWPLVRDDLALSYTQIGLLLSVPNVVALVVEPALGLASVTWRRRALVVGGGLCFALALGLAAGAPSFWVLLVAFSLLYPASGAFVSLSQGALMDLEPERREHNMARWTLAGAVGAVLNVATGRQASVNELADTIGAVLGKPVEKQYLPVRTGDVRDSWANVDEAKRLLGYEAQIGLEDGIELTAAFPRPVAA